MTLKMQLAAAAMLAALTVHGPAPAAPSAPPLAAAPKAEKAPTAPNAANTARATRPAKLPRRYTIEQFSATVRMFGASFSVDGKHILFSSNASGIFNAYTVPAAGGKAQALTASTTDSIYGVGYFPGDNRLLFTRDNGGDEQNHLFVRELDGSERDLTPGAKLKADFQQWAGDDSAFFVTTNERDPRFFDVYRYDATTYERSLLFKNDAGMDVASISADGRWVALNKSKTTADADIHLYDTRSQQLKHLTPHTGNVAFRALTFDPASQHLFFLSDEGSEFTRLVTYSLADGTVREHERADWDIRDTVFSRDGRLRTTLISQDGSRVVRTVDTTTGKPLTLPPLPAGELRGVSFSRDSQQIAFYVNGDRSPSNLYSLDLKSRKLTRLSQTLPKDIAPADLVEARVVRFKSFDGMVVPSIYYQPHEASPAHKVPAVVFVHGGPGGQSTRGYNALAQYLANQGYAVLAINNRGSSGYGKTFFTADDRKHGREPLWDCIEAKTYLASLGVIDPERIAIMGGSYGGYMVLAALAFRPEAFKVGVDIFGVSNWLRTLESIPPYWESFRQALYAEIGDPATEREMLVASSPLFHAKEIRKPLFVVQGANDPRVIKPESDDIVDAVKKNGVPVEYLVFDDEGHGFSKKKNEMEAYRRMLQFLDKHLKSVVSQAPR